MLLSKCYIHLHSSEKGISFLELSWPPLDQGLGGWQGPVRAQAQGPGPHFLLNIRSQVIQILQLPAFQPLEAALAAK